MDFNYYFDNLFRISAINPDDYFVVTDNSILIRLDHLLNKLYKIDHREIIEVVIARFSKGRYVYFYFYDGGNPNLSGFKEFLEYLQNQYNLDREHTVVATYQRTTVPNAVVLFFTNIAILAKCMV